MDAVACYDLIAFSLRSLRISVISALNIPRD